MRALERYARAHAIDLVLDRHQLGEDLLVVSAGADITAAFLRDYNVTSMPKPKPRPGAR
jgi:hypothetical protein